MIIFLEQHRMLLERMIQSGIEFLVIGGYAVNYYGYNRVTGDMDIWIKPDNNTRDSLVEVLSSFDFSQEGLEKLKKVDFSGVFMFYIWEKPYKVDFLTKIAGSSFDETYSAKTIANLDGLMVPFISRSDLIASKIVTDRLKDKLDVEELQKIQRLMENRE